MKKRTVLFLILSAIIAFAPLVNWQVDELIIRGIVWRLTMLSTFYIGTQWNGFPRPKPKAVKTSKIV